MFARKKEMDGLIMQQEIRALKALGDENRLTILHLLHGGEKCACMLLNEMKISQPTLSHHMKILCDANLVASRKEGKWMNYRIADDGLREITEFLQNFVTDENE